MISMPLYRRTTEAQWKGTCVRNTRIVRNGYVELPVGTVFSIIGKQKGFSLRSEACTCCGMRAHISKVSPEILEVIE